jgi:hypothetical protein
MSKTIPSRRRGIESFLWVPINLNETKIPYRHLLPQWVPIGTYNLNWFLQACMLHLFKASPCPLRFGDASIFFQCNVFYFPQCRHGLATSSQTVSVGHERNEQPKNKPRTSWRLLRRLIGESRDPCRFVSYGTLQVANTQTEPALQIQLICFLLNHEYESGSPFWPDPSFMF